MRRRWMKPFASTPRVDAPRLRAGLMIRAEDALGGVSSHDSAVPSGSAPLSFRSVRRVASSAARAGLPRFRAASHGSPHHFRPDRVTPAKVIAIGPSAYAYPASLASASPGRARAPRGAP